MGIIPAYAGNTWCRWAVARCPWDHPRVCGEHPHFSVVNNGGAGSSPRMRGTRGFSRQGFGCGGIIPAYAGNTGDGRHDVGARLGSSPRMRGTPLDRVDGQTDVGIIPAYAGNTYDVHVIETPAEDHPRVCGEHPCSPCSAVTASGSSPRMRGTH